MESFAEGEQRERMASLDSIDRRLLAELQAEGRVTNVELAQRVGLTAPPCLRRVRALVSPRQFQIFSCYVLKGWSPERVKKELGVNAAQVYLAKHRVGRILKREAAKLSETEQ